MKRRTGRLATPSRRSFKLLLLLVIVGGGLYLFVAGESGYLRLRAQRAELDLRERQAAALKVENDSLKTAIRLLESDLDYLEKVAREEYGMMKPGERVFRISPEGASSREGASSGKRVSGD